MPAVLLADVRSVATELPGTAAGGARAEHQTIVEHIVRTQNGTTAQTQGEGRLVFFENPAGAVACALAMQSRLAEYNRRTGEAGRVLMRIAVHATGDSGAAPRSYRLTDREFQVASLILQATPAGRIFLSREAQVRCPSAAVCAFLPLGTEYFSGLPEPVDIYEAFRLPRLGETPLTTPRTAGTPAARQTPTGPSPVPVHTGFLRAPAAAWAATILLAAVLYAAHDLAALVLCPFDLANFAFHSAGHFIFGLAVTGGGIGGALLPLAAQVIMPAALLVQSWAQGRTGRATLGLLWLGQCLLSIGSAWGQSGWEAGSFAGCVKSDGAALFQAMGWLAGGLHAGALSLTCLGCVLVAAAAVQGYRNLRP